MRAECTKSQNLTLGFQDHSAFSQQNLKLVLVRNSIREQKNLLI